MTSKEKAEELVEKYLGNHLLFSSGIGMTKKQAKGCALVATEEIIEQWDYIDTYLADMNGELNPNLKYWLEVKQEINKL